MCSWPLLSSPAQIVPFLHLSPPQRPLRLFAQLSVTMASPVSDADILPKGAFEDSNALEDEKPKLSISKETLSPRTYDVESSSDDDNVVVSTAEEIVTKIIHVDDDPTLNPWTFRMFFLGM